MLSKDYLRPALACLLLALLFPVYWLTALDAAGPDLAAGYADNVRTLDWSDLLYAALGLLEIYVLLGLKRVLHEHYDYRGLDVVLILTMCNAALFSIGLAGVDVAVALMGADGTRVALLVEISAWLSQACMFGFGLLALAAALLLLSAPRQFPASLILFAIATLLWGALQLTVVFSFLVLGLFPLSLVLLAATMLSQPQTIEVV